MKIQREHYLQHGQMWTRYRRMPDAAATFDAKLLQLGGQIKFVAENNWLRRLLYFFGARRALTRRV